jgi:ssDNA-binding Zn-finger/Zn-ribbon topoisomerase 1
VTNRALASKYIEQHDSGRMGHCSPFNGLERLAIIEFGKWLDEIQTHPPERHGPCPLCGAEVYLGHPHMCSGALTESERLRADLDWIARMGVSIKTLPDGTRYVSDDLGRAGAVYVCPKCGKPGIQSAMTRDRKSGRVTDQCTNCAEAQRTASL